MGDSARFHPNPHVIAQAVRLSQAQLRYVEAYGAWELRQEATEAWLYGRVHLGSPLRERPFVYINTPKGRAVAEPGDWIVLMHPSPGLEHVAVYDDATFQAFFQPMGEPA